MTDLTKKGKLPLRHMALFINPPILSGPYCISSVLAGGYTVDTKLKLCFRKDAHLLEEKDNEREGEEEIGSPELLLLSSLLLLFLMALFRRIVVLGFVMWSAIAAAIAAAKRRAPGRGLLGHEV